MGKKPNQDTRGVVLLVYLALVALLLGGCATPSAYQTQPGEAPVPLIQSMKVSPSLERTVLEVSGTRAIPYTAFRLTDPPRIVLDLQGGVGKDLPLLSEVNQGSVRVVLFEKGEGSPAMTRMVIALYNPVEYEVKAEDERIRVVLSYKPFLSQSSDGAGEASPAVQRVPVKEAAAPVPDPAAPRLFFDPKPTDLNQVMGIDFVMLDQGKSRIVVSTDKKGAYDLERKGANTLLLKLSKSSIPPQLLREIDPSQFAGVVERIRPVYSQSENQVSLAILLKEMVPFHVDQKEKGITVEFGPTSVKPAEKKIVPLQLAAQAQPAKAAAQAPVLQAAAPGIPAPVRGDGFGPEKRGYTGAPMTMDFVNADVTNILRLIGEVSNLNIVWGPEVKGTVSMRLKNVPWDQALDLVLANNNLSRREEGNVIWVTTKAQMTQIEAEEKRKKDDKQREVDERLKREKADEKKEEMKTAYLTVNYKDVNNIRDIIDKTVRSPEGKITVDTQTKTIILYDRVSKLAEAKTLKERLDQATAQVMIEARIVTADTGFSRELGVKWNVDQQIRRNRETSWTGTPPWAINNVETNYPVGSKLYNPSFASSTSLVAKTAGFLFTKLSRGGLTGTFIDAQLALAETEGKTRTLSAPKIVTRDTVKASIQQGTKIVIPSGTDSNGNKTYQQVDASLKLEVKPQITPNNMVIMEVKVSKDNPNYAEARGENIPIDTKSADTSMMVASGDTVVIGGIYIEEEGDSDQGIPGLKDIPILGWLFKANTKNISKKELLIFLTPTVLTAS